MTTGFRPGLPSDSSTPPILADAVHLGTTVSANQIILSSSGTPTNNAELDSSWTPHFNDGPTSKVTAYWKMNNDWTDAAG